MSRSKRCPFAPGDVVAVNDPRARNVSIIISVHPDDTMLRARIMTLCSGSAPHRFVEGTFGPTAFKWIASGRKVVSTDVSSV